VPSERCSFEEHHVARHNMPIHNILSTAPKSDGNVMPEHVGATIHD
jgi:hypothetical protein